MPELTLSEKFEAVIKIHKIMAGAEGACALGGLAGTYYAPGYWKILPGLFTAWEAAAVVQRAMKIRKGRQFMADPMFFLAAVQHDLAGLDFTGSTGNGHTFTHRADRA